jgi:hypothetical protein
LERVTRFIPFCGTGTGLFWKGWKFMFWSWKCRQKFRSIKMAWINNRSRLRVFFVCSEFHRRKFTISASRYWKWVQERVDGRK